MLINKISALELSWKLIEVALSVGVFPVSLGTDVESGAAQQAAVAEEVRVPRARPQQGAEGGQQLAVDVAVQRAQPVGRRRVEKQPGRQRRERESPNQCR